MSAFICTRMHVASIVNWYARSRSNWDQDRHADDYRERCADLLMAQNVRSVAHRYPDDVEDRFEAPFTLADFRNLPGLNPIEVVKACHCLAYQSCETDDWNETPAKALLDRIESCAVHSLPGYDEARWELSERREAVAR